MKFFISLLLLVSFISQAALADCDFSKGIIKLPDGGYRYSPDCHLKVGSLVQDNATKDRQIGDLTQALQLKDLAIAKSDSRTQLWVDTNDKLQDRISKIDQLQSSNNFLYFGLGILAAVGVGFATARLIHP